MSGQGIATKPHVGLSTIVVTEMPTHMHTYDAHVCTHAHTHTPTRQPEAGKGIPVPSLRDLDSDSSSAPDAVSALTSPCLSFLIYKTEW